MGYSYIIKRLCICVLLIFIALRSTSFADCFISASERYAVPNEVLMAIANIESKNHPLAINVKGRPFYPDDFLEAIRIIHENEGNSFDIGVMQVNRWWFDKFGYSYFWGLNRCWNIHFGAYILNYELQRAQGDIWKAVGRYHSPSDSRQKQYISKVMKVWQKAQK